MAPNLEGTIKSITMAKAALGLAVTGFTIVLAVAMSATRYINAPDEIDRLKVFADTVRGLELQSFQDTVVRQLGSLSRDANFNACVAFATIEKVDPTVCRRWLQRPERFDND